MRSQLSFIRRVVCSLYVLLLFGHSVSLAADKYTVEGVVEGADGKAQIKLTEGVKDYDDKTDRKGSFKLKRVLRGKYTLQVVQKDDVIHEQSINVEGDIDNLEVKIGSSSVAAEVITKTANLATEANTTQPASAPVPAAQTADASGGASNDFILNELNFEIKKLTAEFKHLSREMDDLKALSKMWINPLTIYSKEIINY